MNEVVTPHGALKLIKPGSVQAVHFLFTAIGGETGYLRVAKSEARRMLRGLSTSAHVRVNLSNPYVAFISGEAVVP